MVWTSSATARRSRRRVVGVLLAVACMAAACGDDDDDDDAASGTDTTVAGTGATDAGSGGSEAPTGEPIKIGGVSMLTTPGGPSQFTFADVGAEARYERANREGGIDGRPIDYLGTQDDGGDATANLNALRALVLNDDALVVAPVATLATGDPTNFMADNTTPYFGISYSLGFCGADYGFGINGCLLGDEQGFTVGPSQAAEILGGAEGKTFATAYPPQFANGVHNTELGAEHVGFDVCHAEADLPSTPTTDFSAFAEDILSDCDGGPDVFYGSTADLTGGVLLVQAMKDRGWEGFYLNPVYAPSVLDDATMAATLEGSYMSNVGYSVPEAQVPIFDTIQADLDAIGKGDTPITSGLVIGYISADMAIALVEHAAEVGGGADGLTGEAIATAGADWLYEGVEDLVGPVQFPAARTTPVGCGTAVKVEDGALVPGIPFACYENFDFPS